MNEALDCRVQALAALCLLNPLWAAVEKNLAPRLPFPEQAMAERPPATGHAHGLAGKGNGMQVTRVGARGPWVNRWRR